MSRPVAILLVVVGAVVLFLLGVIFSLPKVKTNPTPTPLPIATGKPNVSESIKTPTPRETPPVSSQPGQLPPGQNWGWVVNEGTKVHASAGMDGAVLATLRYGRRVRVLGTEEGWHQILLEKRKTGFVQAQFVKGERPSDVPAADPSEASKVLQDYFQEINAHRWAAAYDLLSFDFKRSLRYADFEAGYSKTESSAFRIVKVQTLTPEKMLFQVELLNAESSGTRGYRADYLVTLEQGEWHIAQADQREVPADSLGPMDSATPGSTSTPGKEKKPFSDPTADAESD